ncbi:glycoside hydrolase family 31 protein [Biscogniauxia mediterranea]|nr:glycoside hydrolase family 31 protein [Biscogniauxia mediterranea]
MQPFAYMDDRISPREGVGYSITLEPPPSASDPLALVNMFLNQLDLWYYQSMTISKFLYIIAVFSSASFVYYRFSRQGARRGTMARVSLMFIASLTGLFGLILSQRIINTEIVSMPHLNLKSLATTATDDVADLTFIPNIADPQAVDAQDVCPGYKASNVKETSNGLTADLFLAGDACNVYGHDIAALTLTVEYQAEDRLHVEILPKYIGQENHTWFILPEEIIAKPKAESESTPATDLQFSWENEPSFSFKVTRKSTGDVLFSTEGSRIVFEDQFIEFSSSLPENYNLYGLGETIHGFRLGNNLTRTIYAADIGDLIDENLYGSHPIYLDTRYFEVDESGALSYAPDATDTSATYKSYTHGVFQRNVHGQEVLLRDSNITWRAIGGTIDLYFYQGPSQAEVTKSYQKSAIGLPAMHQYWTFGFHQCRWGYKNWTELQDVIDNFTKSEIPIETIWTDIDYMNAYRDFENDPVNFGYDEGAEFLSNLHKGHRHYVPIIDSGVYAPDPTNASDAYPPFDRGVEQDAFILNPDGSLYIGEVWPGFSVWGDWIGALFNGTGANRWWISEVAEYHSKVDFDGIWIDMSEVSSFCAGSCGSSSRQYPVSKSVASIDSTTLASGGRDVNYPPYAINNGKGELAGNTVSPNATHHGGALEYDFHNVFGHQILNATYYALLNVFPGKRPFIIGRSTLAGSGKVAGHWGGDNYSTWPYLFFSIPQALSFALFGIPMFGVDTCGFADDSSEELCSRWMQLSAFFPFYRNHNEINAAGQEPYLWPSVAEASRAAMRIRYALLPYLYTTFYLSHATGSTTMRALAWEFPDEPWLAAADRQFLLGPALLVTPCLVEGATTVDGVFPGAGTGAVVWYDWYNQTAVAAGGVAPAQNVTIDAPLGHIPLYVRGGHVLPMQEPRLTTAEARATPWSLLVALDRTGEAQGALYLDDGESVEPEERTWVDFTVSESALRATPSGSFVDTNALGNVTVMGVSGEISKVQLGGEELAPGNWNLDAARGVLKVTGLDGLTQDGAWSEEWVLRWS